MSIIKYNNNNINDWNFGASNVKKAYRNNAVCFFKIDSTPTPPTPTEAKYTFYLSNGNTASAVCDSTSAITVTETTPYSTSMVSAEIGDCVTNINGAFQNCNSLSSVTFPADSVTTIGNYAFYSCTSLSSVTIPDSVTSIGNYAFSNCGLTSINVGSGVTSLGIGVFTSCNSLTSMAVDSNNEYYDSRDNCNAIIETDYDALWVGCSTTVIPTSVTSIETNAFNGCSSLEEIVIPDSVESIGNYSFGYCTSLSSITIGSGVTSIGDGCFSQCTSLTEIVIPDSLTSIGNSAFDGCSSLSSVTIGSGISEINDYAFYYCSSLEEIYIEAETPPTLGEGAFDDTNDCPIYVPCNSLNGYKSAWSEYASRIEGIGECGYDLPDVPFVVNYNAKNYNATTHTIAKTEGQLNNMDAVISGTTANIIDHSSDGYIELTGTTSDEIRAVISNSSTNQYFNRTSSSPNITIIAKVLTRSRTEGSIIVNRNSSTYNWMYRHKSGTLTFHGTSEQGSITVSNSQPNICSVRVDSNSLLTYNNYTNGTSSTKSSFTYGSTTSNNGGALFSGYSNYGGEFWKGLFYWVYMSQNTLTDEQVQQVIDYNENL